MSRRRHEVLSVPLPATPSELLAVLELAAVAYQEPVVRAGEHKLGIWAFGALGPESYSPVGRVAGTLALDAGTTADNSDRWDSDPDDKAPDDDVTAAAIPTEAELREPF